MDISAIHAILSGHRRGLGYGLLRAALAAASVPYALAMRLRRWAYRRGLPLFRSQVIRDSHRLSGVPIICVGNITTGGTGKTPMVAMLVRHLKESGRRPAVLTRGYKASGGKSDEAQVLAAACGSDVPIVVNADRVAGARAAIAAGADVLVMDDGFQHRRLARSLDIVLIDATNPFGYGWCLPRGLLREPPSALRDAHAIVITHCEQVEPAAVDSLHRQLHKLAPAASIHRAAHIPDHLIDGSRLSQPLDALVGKKVFAFCGLGNPETFFHHVRELRYHVVGRRAFPDHAAYGPADLAALLDQAETASADALLTTEKDFVKIAGKSPGDTPIWQLAVRVEMTHGREELLKLVDRA